ncbi:hypothetical protein [Brevibacillus reuszeri]|uniref:hypothetical protein n=1 Tax=Brevibacillus reuszeri TaxID=54915 RepID=UPI000A8AA6F6|nr:hypothetical protein [Brevibacillus reuszeri]MED1855384.1 hypothetical protein [Brevibacillus reuszeri]
MVKLEKMLEEFKETANQTLLRDLHDTTKLEQQIRQKMNTSHNRKRPYLAYTVCAAVAIVMLFGGAAPFFKQNETVGGGHATTVPPAVLPSDPLIMQKVQELKSLLHIDLSQEQVKEQLSTPDHVASENGGSGDDGADEYWEYSLLSKVGYVSSPKAMIMIDEERLLNRDTAISVNIAWKDKKLHWYSLIYPQGKEIYLYKMNSNGTVSESRVLESQSPPSILDLTPEEEQLYFSYMDKKKDEILRDMTIEQILKMYIRAQQDGDLEMQYALHIQDEEYEKPTLEQFLSDVKKDPIGAENTMRHVKMLREQADSMEYQWTDKTEGIVWIKFKDDRKKLGYRMIHNKQRIWKVSWMPLQ